MLPGAVLDAVEQPLVLVDDDGHIEAWNQRATALAGRDGDGLEGAEITDLVEPGDRDRLLSALQSAGTARPIVVEATFTDAGGERRTYELRIAGLDGGGAVAVFDGPNGPGVEPGRVALERMTDAFFAVDADWRITYVNGAARPILSAAAGVEDGGEDLVGRDLWAAIPDAVGTQFEAQYRRAMETGEASTFEARFEPMDTWFEVRAYPHDRGLSVYFSDVTGRRERIEALENREVVLREMYEVIADRDRSFEEQVEALLALGRGELDTDYGTLSAIRGGEYHFEVVDSADGLVSPGDVVPLSATNCEIAASEEETLVLGDIERDAPEETDRAGYTDLGISCYLGAPVFVDGEVYGTFCFYDTSARAEQFSDWDVTLVDLMSRWVGYELERQAANRRLSRQNARLERFAGIVSHDLKNPLNVAMLGVETARETDGGEGLARVEDALGRMETLIDDLLQLARAGADIEEPEAVRLGTVLRECWENVETGSAALTVETDRAIEADPQRLRQLLENLLRNAVEHGGDDVSVHVGDLTEGFYVEDDGPGVPEDERERVFEGGYSTAERGTGFGLSIVEEVAEAHGWEVSLNESEWGGARFEFTGVDRA